MLPRSTRRPGLDTLGRWLHPNLRSERRLETTGDWTLRLDPSSPLPIDRDATLLAPAVLFGFSLCLPGDRPAGVSPSEFSRTKARLDIAGRVHRYRHRVKTGQACDLTASPTGSRLIVLKERPIPAPSCRSPMTPRAWATPRSRPAALSACARPMSTGRAR